MRHIELADVFFSFFKPSAIETVLTDAMKLNGVEMSKQHFAAIIAALAVTAAIYSTLGAASATTPEARGNPAVTDEIYQGTQLAKPAPASPVRNVVA